MPEQTRSRGDLAATGILVIGLTAVYFALSQEGYYGDGRHFIDFLERGRLRYHHVAYLPLASAVHNLLAPVLGSDPRQALLLLSATGGAAGVAFLFLALRTLGITLSTSLGAAFLAAVTPSVLFFSTCIEVHSLHFGAAGGAVLLLARCSVDGRRSSIPLALAVCALTTFHLAGLLWMPAIVVFVMRRGRIRQDALPVLLVLTVFFFLLQTLQTVDGDRHLLMGLRRVLLPWIGELAFHEVLLPTGVLIPTAAFCFVGALATKRLRLADRWSSFSIVLIASFLPFAFTSHILERGAYFISLVPVLAIASAALLGCLPAPPRALALAALLGIQGYMAGSGVHDWEHRYRGNGWAEQIFRHTGQKGLVLTSQPWEWRAVYKHSRMDAFCPTAGTRRLKLSDPSIREAALSIVARKLQVGLPVVVLRSLAESEEEDVRMFVEELVHRYGQLRPGEHTAYLYLGVNGSQPATEAIHDAKPEQAILALEALGYAGAGDLASKDSGLVRFDADRAHPGFNLCVANHATEAVLMDMHGATRHRWSKRIPGWRKTQVWRKVHVFPDGDLLVVVDGVGLIRLGRSSNLIWANKNQAHHDVFVDRDGSIFVLVRSISKRPDIAKKPIAEDFVAVLSPGGEEIRRTSLVDAFLRSEQFRWIWEEREHAQGDVLHSNALRVLREPWNPFRPGQVLTSMRHLNAVCVVDLDSENVVWAHKGGFRWQHDPRILPNGNLLLFDNKGLRRRRSRVLELQLDSLKKVWSYGEEADETFFSRVCGAASRLPNGNTLITESMRGRSFEVTADNEIVWEYVTPHRHPKSPSRTAVLFEVQRLDPDYFGSWLSKD